MFAGAALFALATASPCLQRAANFYTRLDFIRGVLYCGLACLTDAEVLAVNAFNASFASVPPPSVPSPGPGGCAHISFPKFVGTELKPFGPFFVELDVYVAGPHLAGPRIVATPILLLLGLYLRNKFPFRLASQKKSREWTQTRDICQIV